MRIINPHSYRLPEGLEENFERIFEIFRSYFSLGEYEVELSFVNELEIKKLNFQYRGKDKVTDVLSFPLSTSPSERLLGAIYFCYPFIYKNNRDTLKEFCLLLIHSHLHLLGYEHGEKMFSLQEEFFKTIF